MYNIIKDIWKNPGAAYSPMPMWIWNDTLDADSLVAQLDEFHKKGIDALLVCQRAGMNGVEYLSDGYFDIVETVLEAAKKRFMLVAFCDDATYLSGSAHGEVLRDDATLAYRRLYALPMSEEVPDGDEPQFCVYVKHENGAMVDCRSDMAEGYTGYNLVLGYAGETVYDTNRGEDDCKPGAPGTADLLNPAATEKFIRLTHERYYERLSPYFGQTLIGFFTDGSGADGRPADGDGISWSYGMAEEFLEVGGELSHLAALFFEPKEKKIRREATHIYAEAYKKRLCMSYYAPLGDWCEKHGVALMGHPRLSTDIGCLKYFTIPGQAVANRSVAPGTELVSKDSVAVKAAADMARHKGQSRSLCEVFEYCGDAEKPCHFTPDDMMWYLNYCFARGCSMIVPHAFYFSDSAGFQGLSPDVGMYNIWWKDYRRIAGYIKRMSWLGSVGTNNPHAAVLCSDEYVPVTPVAPLYENGYTFNYLSIDDFMERAHIHGGTVRIDRYSYDTVLVDGRLRLNTEIVRKLGQFAVGGGKLFRGPDFIGFMKKNVRRASFFEGETGGKLRFLHYTKSGCPFFVMINEGNEKIEGRLVTDIAAKAEVFDPFTGTASPISAVLHDSGFSYPVTVGAHEAKVIGMDPSALPVIEEPEKIVLSEIVSLGEGRMAFDFRPEVGRHAILSFTEIDEIADIRVNGKDAARLIFKPYETDITNYLHSGENTVEVELTGSIACKYGSPVPAGFEGCTVRICDKPDAEGAAKGENDEMWDVYDKDRRKVGCLQRRGDPMKDGDYHIVVHVWIRNKKGEYLLTKRAPDKMFPLSWECTGGSALAGEDSLTAALREVREETGLELDPANGSVVIHADGDNYFGDIWLFREEFDLDKVRLQAGETVDKRKATKDEIIALIESCEFVPYDYLGRLFEID